VFQTVGGGSHERAGAKSRHACRRVAFFVLAEGCMERRLRFRVAFEPTRLSGEYLHHAYENIAPITQRQVRTENTSLESQVEDKGSEGIEGKEESQ
jgi:hypothetical protein